MATPTTRKYIEDIAKGDYIRPDADQWYHATGPVYEDTYGTYLVPVVASTGQAYPLALTWAEIDVADGAVPEPFTPAGMRRAADEVQERINDLTVKRDRLLMFAEDQERK